MKLHITAPTVKNLGPSDKPYEVVDTDLKGFLARVQPSGGITSGGITYYFSYRVNDGTRKRFRIGKHPGITVPAARKAAEQLAAQVIQQKDPQAEKKTARQIRAKAKKETLTGFIDHNYKEWCLTHQRRGEETLKLLAHNFGHLYPKKLKDISAWDMQKWRVENKG